MFASDDQMSFHEFHEFVETEESWGQFTTTFPNPLDSANFQVIQNFQYQLMKFLKNQG